MAFDNEFSLLFLYAVFFTARANFDPQSDETRFVINFPGPLPKGDSDVLRSASDMLQEDDSVVMLTNKNEKYKCIIPSQLNSPNQDGVRGSSSSYLGSSEEELLAPLLTQTSCSYKIEPYWTYELCHNKFIRQYHEEREAEKDIKLQEYYLGYYNNKVVEPEESETTEEVEQTEQEVKVKQIGGVDLPYYEISYTDGTLCDLSRKPRRSSIRYICHIHGRGEIYELKEISSCEYEVIILTQLLCSHPHYASHKDPVNQINCHSIEDSARRPDSLINLELENTQARYNKPERRGWKVVPEKGDSYFKIDMNKDGMRVNDEWDEDFEWDEVDWEAEFGMSLEAVKKFIEQTMEEQDQLYPKTQIQKPPVSRAPATSAAPGKQSTTAQKSAMRGIKTTDADTASRTANTATRTANTAAKTGMTSSDKQLLRHFLSGEYCIQGGTGWWKHEFCYGRGITQYHEDNSGKTVITLGLWDADVHREWIKAHPAKQPKHVSKDNQVVHHYYGNGEICDLTGKPRHVEVKLRCKDNPGNPHSISIYLLETRACQYQLVVESPILCMVLEKADEDGIIPYSPTTLT